MIGYGDLTTAVLALLALIGRDHLLPALLVSSLLIVCS